MFFRLFFVVSSIIVIGCFMVVGLGYYLQGFLNLRLLFLFFGGLILISFNLVLNVVFIDWINIFISFEEDFFMYMEKVIDIVCEIICVYLILNR